MKRKCQFLLMFMFCVSLADGFPIDRWLDNVNLKRSVSDFSDRWELQTVKYLKYFKSVQVFVGSRDYDPKEKSFTLDFDFYDPKTKTFIGAEEFVPKNLKEAMNVYWVNLILDCGIYVNGIEKRPGRKHLKQIKFTIYQKIVGTGPERIKAKRVTYTFNIDGEGNYTSLIFVKKEETK